MSMSLYPLNLRNKLLMQPNQGQLIAESYPKIIVRYYHGIASILVSTHFLFSINTASSVLIN